MSRYDPAIIALREEHQHQLAARPAAFPNPQETDSKRVAEVILEELTHFYENFEPQGSGRTLTEQHSLVNKPFFGFIQKANESLLMCRHYPPMYFDTLHKGIEYSSYLGSGGSQMAKKLAGSDILYRSTYDPEKVQNRGEAYDVKMENPMFSFLIQSMRKLLGLSQNEIQTLEREGSISSPSTDSLEPAKLVEEISQEERTPPTPPEAHDKPTVPSFEPERFKPQVLANTTSGIQLADRYMLDDIQDPIFREEMSEPILISGPPGTGKTTVQVKRLAQKTKWQFLTQSERQGLQEDEWDENSNWLFFTPSNLLKSYLKEALAAEFLAASDQRVRVWEDYRTELLKRIGFFNKQLKRAKATASHLKQTDSPSLSALAISFKKYLFQSLGAKYDDKGNTSCPPLSSQGKLDEAIRRVSDIFHAYRANDEVLEKFYRDSAAGLKAQGVDSNEMTVLLFATLSLVREVQDSYGLRIQAPIKGQASPSFAALKDEAMVVSIDEASDFSALELACMALLSDPRKMSITLSGDLMQRLTSKGIQEWREMEDFGIDLKQFDLYRPYRQTSRLTEIANVLDSRHARSNLIIESDASDPVVKLQQAPTQEAAAEWVATQILEAAEEFPECLPTIGVLVPESSEVSKFAKLLEDHLYSHGIDIEAVSEGKFFGDTGKVRVFSLEHIKGLEFDTVFFCHLDDLEKSHADLLTRFLYVGISRCKRQLSMTYKKHLPQALESITPYIVDLSGTDLASIWRQLCDVSAISEESVRLLDEHFSFYQKLFSGAREPSSPKQQQFIDACRNGYTANDIHVIAYQEFLRAKH